MRGAAAWGLTPGSGGWSFIARMLEGLLAGGVMMAALFVLLVACGARSGGGHLESVEWLPLLAGFLAAAAAVALVEELWFRGALHSAFQRIGGVPAALFAVAVLYSSVHFIDSNLSFAAPEVAAEVASKCWAMPFVARRLRERGFRRGAGRGRSPARRRTSPSRRGGGMHRHPRRVVLVNKIGRTLTAPEPDSRWAWLAAGYDGVIAWAACALFSLIALLCWQRLAPARTGE